MRTQFNIPMDGNNELPEKIRKLCKVRGYRISDFCIRILNEAIDKEIAALANKDSETLDERMNRLENEVQQLRSLLETKISLVDVAPTQKDNNSELVKELSKLLDNSEFPQNNSTKLKKRIIEIIETLLT
jgi:hypothetical protein